MFAFKFYRIFLALKWFVNPFLFHVIWIKIIIRDKLFIVVLEFSRIFSLVKQIYYIYSQQIKKINLAQSRLTNNNLCPVSCEDHRLLFICDHMCEEVSFLFNMWTEKLYQINSNCKFSSGIPATTCVIKAFASASGNHVLPRLRACYL